MKKILHIPNYYLPHTGGIEDVCYNIVHYLSFIEGIEQKIICFNSSCETIRDECEGVEIIRVGVVKKIASQALSFNYRKELKTIINSFKPDVVHFHAPNPFISYILLSVLPSDVKLIIHWHSDIVAQKVLYNLIRPIEKKLLKRSDLIIATSPNYIEESEPLRMFRNKVLLIQNIINPQKFECSEKLKFKVEEIKQRFDNRPIVLFVGRHVPYKGLQYLLKAASLLTNDCEILIGGSGPLTNKLKKENECSNIHYLGRIPDEDLAAYYYAANVFAFPSVTKNEAFGVVLAEAMYCYTPAVTFTIKGSGVNWVNLNGFTGVEVENSNVEELSVAIDKLIGDSLLQKKYALQARKRVEELFVIDCISSELDKLYI